MLLRRVLVVAVPFALLQVNSHAQPRPDFAGGSSSNIWPSLIRCRAAPRNASTCPRRGAAPMRGPASPSHRPRRRRDRRSARKILASCWNWKRLAIAKTINESGDQTGGEAGIRMRRSTISNVLMARDFWL